MNRACATLLATAAVFVTCGRAATTTSGPSPNPASLSFTYQVNTTPLPPVAKVTISLPSTAVASTVIYASICTQAATTAGNCPASWLSVTPAFGHSPLALSVQVNPSGMAPGSYTATIYFWTSPDVGSNSVPVTLSITNPPSTLVVNPYPANLANFTPASGTTPDTLSFTYTTGSAWVPLQSQLNVATNGGIIPFSATVANASGGSGSGSGSSAVWLRINPVGSTNAPSLTTSGVANSGSSVGFYVSLDQPSVQALLPGSYGGTVTFAANTAANGSHVVAVNLVISAGAPAVGSLFPTSVVMAPSVDPVVTINGTNFFSTSVASVGVYGGPDPTGLQCTQTGTPTAMTSQQLLSQTVLQASIPKANALVASQNQLCICVTNPAPPSNPGQAPACAPLTPDYTFHVISSSSMAVTSVVNAASYLQSAKQVTPPDPVSTGQTSISPGEIISIFGQNLGPATPVPAIPGPSPDFFLRGISRFNCYVYAGVFGVPGERRRFG
jgi:hypothetical protein